MQEEQFFIWELNSLASSMMTLLTCSLLICQWWLYLFLNMVYVFFYTFFYTIYEQSFGDFMCFSSFDHPSKIMFYNFEKGMTNCFLLIGYLFWRKISWTDSYNNKLKLYFYTYYKLYNWGLFLNFMYIG